MEESGAACHVVHRGGVAARLQPVHERRVRGLPALAQVLRDLAPAAPHARAAQARQPLEQRVRAQLQPSQAAAGARSGTTNVGCCLRACQQQNLWAFARKQASKGQVRIPDTCSRPS